VCSTAVRDRVSVFPIINILLDVVIQLVGVLISMTDPFVSCETSYSYGKLKNCGALIRLLNAVVVTGTD